MAYQQFRTSVISTAVWLAEALFPEKLLPGGGKLVAADFPAVAGKKFVKSGTLVGRTFAERDAGAGFGPWTTGDEEVYLTAIDVFDAAEDDDITLVRRQVLVKENWLPGWATYTAGQRAALRAAYQVVRG